MNERHILVGFGSAQVSIACDDDQICRELSAHYTHLETKEPTNVVGHVRMYHQSGEYLVHADCQIPMADGTTADTTRFGAMELVKSTVLNRFIQLNSELLWLHAGAAATHDTAILFPGASGRGKSTMVVELVANGWLYLSDEIAPVDGTALTVQPYPQSPARRIHPGKEVASPQELEKSMFRPSKANVCNSETPIRACVFPRYSARAETALLHCGPSEAALRLLQCCINLSSHSSEGFQSIRELVQAVPCFHLIFSNGTAAGNAITTLCSSLRNRQNVTTRHDEQHLPDDTKIRTHASTT